MFEFSVTMHGQVIYRSWNNNLWPRQFVTLRFPHYWPVHKHSLCQNAVSKKRIASLYISVKKITYLILVVGLLRICRDFSVSSKTVYRWITTNCSYMSDMLGLKCYRYVNHKPSLLVDNIKHFFHISSIRFDARRPELSNLYQTIDHVWKVNRVQMSMLYLWHHQEKDF